MPGKPPAEPGIGKHTSVGSGIVTVGVVISVTAAICFAFLLAADGIHRWHWANKYAEGFGKMHAEGLQSLSQLCETFMSPGVIPHIGDEQAKKWSELCFDRAEEVVKGPK